MRIIGLAFILKFITVLSAGAEENGYALITSDGDYSQRPRMEVSYSGLEAELEIGFETGLIRGVASYHFTPRHSSVNRLTWSAPNIEIENITLDNGDVTWDNIQDTLQIRFDDNLESDTRTSLQIEYEARPEFGVHYTPNGTIFSSNLPGGVAHWLPGPIHPRAVMPVQLTFEVPDGQRAVASGELDGRWDSDRGNYYRWVTEHAIPVSDLAFSVGDFELYESFTGTKNVRIYHEQEIMEESDSREMLEHTVSRIRDLERLMRRELPFTSFQIVVLSDDRWETRPYASGKTYVFQRHDNQELQVTRSLIAQWFGISLRTEQWAHSAFITLLQALVAEQAGLPDWLEYDDPLKEAFNIPETLYQTGSMEYWQWARRYIRDRDTSLLGATLSSGLREFSGMEGTWTSGDFSRHLYDLTGKWIPEQDITAPVRVPEYQFQVLVQENGGSGNLRLEISPLADITDDMFEVIAEWERDGRIFQNEFTFHGEGETIQIDTGGQVNNLRVKEADVEHVSFVVEKPFSFWLHQLRRGEEPEQRRKAAEALIAYSSDPDLQLAIQDVMAREENPEVRAGLFKLLAAITSGASGTERRFLEGLTSNHSGIRMVSMRALQAYSGNAQVEEEVLSIIQTSDDLDLVNEAIRTYREIIDDEAFRSFALRFLDEDRGDLLFTETLLEELFEVPVNEGSVDAAIEYLHEGYPFDLRWLSYRQLRLHAAGSDWEYDFLNNYHDDRDPRIRFLTLFSLSELEQEERGPFLEEMMLMEYDIRILKRIEDLHPIE